MSERRPGPRLRVSRGHRAGDLRVIRRRGPRRGLERVLGVAGVFSASYGNVGSSIYYGLGVTALYALGLTPLVFVISGLFFLCTALTYAEGSAAMPEAGGAASFSRRAFGQGFSFMVGWAQILNYLITISISAFTVPNYLSVFWPLLKSWPANAIGGVGVVLALGTLNIVGARESSRLNIALALIDLATQALLVVIGLALVFNLDLLRAGIHLGIAPTWDRLLLGIAISMIAYTGIETASNLSEETRNATRAVPRGILTTFVAVLVMYTLIPLVALSAMPVQLVDGVYQTRLATEFIEDPVLGVVRELGFVGVTSRVVEAWVGILAATILALATNAGMLGMSRLTYSMSRHGQLPAAVGALHPRRRTPVTAIVLTVILASAVIVPGKITLLASLYAFGAMLSFTFAHASIIRLRVSEPELERPFHIPWNWRLRGRQIPVPALIGGGATLFSWFVVVLTQPTAWIIGFPWLGAGLLYYLWRRRRGEVDDPRTRPDSASTG
ncbi:MAG: APC family permease [Dehalococcoidia bacterium]|nr:APC family permease [Dehalococcoidia bacterium]